VVPHIPALHVGVACTIFVVHMVPHDPQLLRSLVTSVHVDPQSMSLPVHPETHEYVLPEPEQSGVATPHFVPHPPQLLVVLTGVSHPWSDPASPQCA
jgi:hypothetical protein